MNVDSIMLLSVGAVALAGLVQSVTGFGFGLVSMALLPLLVGFKDAYTIVSIMVLVTCTMTLLSNITRYRWRQGLGLLISACLAVPIGFYVMVHIPQAWLMRVLGVLICLYSLREVLMSRIRPIRIPARYEWPMGVLSGALSGAFHAGGPPAVIYAYSQDWAKEHIVALLQLVFLIPSIIRMFLVKNEGLLKADPLSIGLLSIVPLVLAIMGGTRILHHVNREQLRTIAFVFLLVIGVKYLTTPAPEASAAQEKVASASAATRPAGWTLVGHAYRGLSQVSFFDAIDKAKVVGVKAIEGRPYRISTETGDAELGPSAPAEALERTKEKLKDAGVTLVSYYAGSFGKDEAAMRALFEFGRTMGIQVFVGEPKPEKLAALDKLANEFGINVAIHNHPRRPNQPAYAYWDPDAIVRMIRKHSKRIGCCADTGHWVRSGLDPVECLKVYEGRLLYLHLKDVSEKGPRGHDVVFGTGVADVDGMLTELHRQRFAGQIAFEYENDVKDRPADVSKCADYVRKIARDLGQALQ